MAVATTQLVAEAFDPTDSSEARGKNNRLLPHALAVLAYAPREGPTSWSTMFILQKIGDVLADLYELPDALTFYRSALALAERGAKFDSSNPHWQVAIAELHICIGEVLKDQGKRPAARDAYKAALATRERLTKIDPSNVDWRHALAECYVNIGRVEGSLAALQTGRAILADLMQASPDDAALAKYLDFIDLMIALVEKNGS